MGCHTLFYTESNYTKEDVKNIFLSKIEKYIKLNEKINDSENLIYWQDLKNKILKDFNKEVIMECMEIIAEDIEYSISKDKFYTNTEYIDLFRIGNYPTDELFSLKETLQFIENNNIKIEENDKIQLEKFWKEHPNGMINFG